MFERYTEKARRVIFFARYEASQYGSPVIESEHLLLGAMRERSAFSVKLFTSEVSDQIRNKVDARVPPRPKSSTSIDLPLSDESKKILKGAANAADELGHRQIGTGHLVLGMLQEKTSFAAECLAETEITNEKAKDFVRQFPGWDERGSLFGMLGRAREIAEHASVLRPRTVRIHSQDHDDGLIRIAVGRCRSMMWHWTKKEWRPQDIVVRKSDGRISFDLSLAAHDETFQLVQNGWNHDLCAICAWKLYVAPEPECSSGYTNGKNWVCLECYDKFLSGPDFFSIAPDVIL
jgi:hypothetical protein